jgi:cellulose synthase/poly-beta-1,6-N-acetylglucosamine synthase-like glycosyltransferase
VTVGWSYLSLIQIVEYLRAFLVGRMGWDYINATTIISGAFGLFKKKAIIEVGGYGTNTIGEDLELLLRIHEHYLKRKRKYQVRFLPDPVCWTEVPSSFSVLGKQRSRWQQGLMEGMWISRRMLFRPWSGVIGNIALPYLLLFELLSAPIELFGYIVTIIGFSLGVISTEVATTFLVVSMLYGWILTLGALIIEEVTFRKYKGMKDYFKLFIGVILEQFGYHQINLFWRLRGMWRYFRGSKNWGEMTRTGFKKAA